MKSKLSLIPAIMILVAGLMSAYEASAEGFIPVRNFSSDVYKGGPQNWTVAQDSIGRIYAGNRDGMMMFDGERWRTRYLPNSTTVRSLLYDKELDRIYAGGSEEFGYWHPDSISGELRYTSLLPTLGENRPQFTEVWNIIRIEDKVWFQSDYHLFRYDGTRTTIVNSPGRISKSALVDNHLYLALDDGRILRFNGSRLVPAPGTDCLMQKKIVGLFSLDIMRTTLVVTSMDGLYLYDGREVTHFDCDLDRFLRDSQVFCASASGNDFVFGTVTRGAVVKNFASDETHYINKESGLQNNTVLGASFDMAGNIWLCLDNGLSYAIYNSPVASLIGPSNDVGAGYASLKIGDKVYFGTNQGLYSAPYPFEDSPSPLGLRRELRGQIWSLSGDGEDEFFISGDAGVFHSKGGIINRIPGLSGAYKVDRLPSERNLAVASTYDHFHLLRKENGSWHDIGPIQGYDDISGLFVTDGQGYIWIAHWMKGIYRLHLNTESLSFDDSRLYNHTNGLPDDRFNSVTVIDGKAVFTTHQGFYFYDYNTGRIRPDMGLNALFAAERPHSLHPLPEGQLFLLESSGMSLARPDANGDLRLAFRPIKTMTDKIINGYEHVNYLGAGELIVANQDGFWTIDTRPRRGGQWTPKPFISAVYVNRDSLVFNAGLSAADATPALTLPYGLSSVRFEFACPDFSSPNVVEYSSYLENYDSGWTPVSPESTREYTRMSEGDYTLHLLATNIATGQTDGITYSFSIAPPWFRSTTAKIAYILIALLLIWAGYFIIRRWKMEAERQIELRKEKELDELRRHTEQEALVKNYEIATLKSEQLERDIKHKSQELSNTTMNMIRKNEILHEIAARIAKIQEIPGLESGTPGIQKKLARIQTAIEDNISHDDDWKSFTRNFDIVYENYTKRLMELHPNLSASDKRLCCYIKMGLSSKEIAPLINISYKSVEMARYRLRKKMELPSETTLTDYLTNL